MSGRAPGRIRIVSGAKRGMHIRVPKGAGVRPTSDMVREAIFDVLGPVGGLKVMDLFAGTGALGLEALSRGAQRCVFVESQPRVATVLRENVDKLQYEDSGRVVVGEYQRVIGEFLGAGEGFDLLFVDPPYRMLAEVEDALAPLLSALLSPDGVVVVEGSRLEAVTFGHYPFFEREYGDTKITMVRVKE